MSSQNMAVGEVIINSLNEITEYNCSNIVKCKSANNHVRVSL